MRFTGDYHLHTRVSDGRGDISEHIRLAKERGLEQIAITDHSFSTLIYHATVEKLEKQRIEIKAFSDCGIKIFQGVEGNIIGNQLDVPHSVIRSLDILTVGFHRFITPSEMRGESKFLFVNGFGSRSAKQRLTDVNTEAYLGVLENYPVDILAHLGHRVPIDFKRVCECARRNGTYVELNEKHLDALEDGIADALDIGVNFIVGTDAHSCKRTGVFDGVEGFIQRHGIPLERVFGVNGNAPTFKNKREWRYGSDV